MIDWYLIFRGLVTASAVFVSLAAMWCVGLVVARVVETLTSDTEDA